MFGIYSQMIALCVERVVATRVQIVRVDRNALRDEDEDEAVPEDEDMGF